MAAFKNESLMMTSDLGKLGLDSLQSIVMPS
jgi:hypothetical protein